MCGRYAILALLEALREQFQTDQISENLQFKKGLCLPTERVIVIIQNQLSKKNQLSLMRWSLIPHFVKNFNQLKKYSLINARSESLEEKPSFQKLLNKNRCLIPADVFYEYKLEGKKKDKYAFTLNPESTFAMAGLWDKWINPLTKEEIYSCTILTTTANEVVQPIHENNRMPVILDSTRYSDWLNTEIKFDSCKNLLQPYDSNKMKTEKIVEADKPNIPQPRQIQKSEIDETQPSLFSSK